MNQQPVTVSRTMVGVIGLVLLAVAAILTVVDAEGKQEMWAGACLKVGMVMAAFWLALPSITRHEDLGTASLWTLLGVLAAALIVARTKIHPRIILSVLGVAVILLRVLRPRRSSPDRPRRNSE